MLTLSKQFAVTLQSSKPFRHVKISNPIEHLYLISHNQRISEVSSSGKLRKLLIPNKDSKILASSISECGNLIIGLFSTGQMIVCSKKKKVFQIFLLPPQIRMSIDLLSPETCNLYSFNKGILFISTSDQIWLWETEEDLNDSNDLSPHLKGNWINLNSVNILRGRSEANSWRSNISESKPNSNSSRPAFQSRFTTHGFSMRVNENFVNGNRISVLRVWLKSINEDSCILESKFLSVSLLRSSLFNNKQSYIRNAEEFAYRGQLEFWSNKGQKDMGLVVKLDHSGSLAAIGVNSSHPYFCQLVFMNPTEGICTTKKLCNYVTVDDSPTTSFDGQTSFWIDDIVWAPQDTFIAIAFKSGFLSIFSRLGEPLPFVLDMCKSLVEPRVFAQTFFTTDPNIIKTQGQYLSVDWYENLIILSDGFTICELLLSNMLASKDMIPRHLPLESDAQDISINISHETNPIPSEIDSGPKSKNIDFAFQLLRSYLSNSHSIQNREVIYSITAWIDTVMPPQLHEEINYTALPNSRFETEARLSNSLVLKKKMHAIDVYTQFCHIICMESWATVNNSELKEWVIAISYQIIKYLLADQQALYAWNALRLFERWIGFKVQRARNMLIVYSLIQYRNHQANHINVVYFLIAYAATRGSHMNFFSVLKNYEEEFLRMFIKINLDLPQSVNFKQVTGISPVNCLNVRANEKSEGSLNYLLGFPCSFLQVNQEICYQLLRGNAKCIEYHVNRESLLLFAYFFDPTEEHFISPVEAWWAASIKSATIFKLLEEYRKLSQVQVAKEKNYGTEASFIYYSLRMYQKLEMLQPANLAFFTINKIFGYLYDSEIPEAFSILKRIFMNENQLELLTLCNPIIKPLFQSFALAEIKKKLLNFVKNIKNNEDKIASTRCLNIYDDSYSEDLCRLIEEFKNLLGSAMVVETHTEKWLDLSGSNLENSDKNLEACVFDIFRYFWCIRLMEKESEGLEWIIRLLAVPEIVEKDWVLDVVIGTGESQYKQSVDTIALYLRKSMFTSDVSDNHSKWLESLQSYPNILHSLNQPAYPAPWVFDADFLNFSRKLIDMHTELIQPSKKLIKNWNSSVKSLSKLYKINGFLKYSDGIFTEAKENKEFDISQLTSILFSSSEIFNATKQEVNFPLFKLQKKRINLILTEAPNLPASTLTIKSLISCKRIIYTLKSHIKGLFTLIKPQKKPQGGQNLTNKHKQKETYTFFSLKPNETKESAFKSLPLKFFNVLKPQGKRFKHRRIHSVMLPSALTQKPFKLIRVQKPFTQD